MLKYLKQKILQITQMEKEKLTSIAGILILISIFLPVNYTYFVFELGSFQEHKWIFGQRFEIYTNTKGEVFYHSRYFFFYFIGYIFVIVFLILAIKIILNAHSIKGKKIVRLGISSIIVLAIESLIQLYIAIFLRPNLVIFLPHIGFVGILIGGILAIISGLKYKKVR